MAHMDIFRHNAFQMVELSAAIQNAPHLPQYLGSLGIFTPKRVRTATISVESKGGVLSLIKTSERGAPIEEAQGEKRELRDFRSVRIARGKTLYAAEIDGIRAFGTTSELQAVQNEVASIMDGATGLRAAVELTHENMRLGAIQGRVLDANGDELFNWFTAFGINQPNEINFDLANATAEDGAIRKKCNQVIRAMVKASAGAWINGQTYAVALCGDNFFDELTQNKETRATYLNQQEASDLRNKVGQAFGTFSYGNILWVNYRGTDDGSTVAVESDKCRFFPVGAPDAFISGFSPAEFLPFVNTPGQDVYAMVVPDKDRQAWVRPEVYSYPLFMCTRPGMLLRAKKG
ncbi:major capsid protein [Comamonas testosteroni]|uniref:major capsid protein n=1 Tax=Comamonas testosteroni TaxID=285 RepID=UPI0006B98E0B|nr:major capsid protein [Comamonas testosteroni]